MIALDRRARNWSEALAEWAIPEEVLRSAPESPWGFPLELFADSARSALEGDQVTPSRTRELEALGEAGTVLDVGAGAGAASLPLAPPATHVTAVDESEKMLDAFDELATARSIPHQFVLGRWPEIAEQVRPADLVTCHHVVYNVPDIVPFLEALNRHAARRVVLEATAVHPQADLNPLWRVIHGIERPSRPVVEDLTDVLTAMKIAVRTERFRRPHFVSGADRRSRVAFARRRLCVGPEHDGEIERLLPDEDRELVTLWWDVR